MHTMHDRNVKIIFWYQYRKYLGNKMNRKALKWWLKKNCLICFYLCGCCCIWYNFIIVYCPPSHIHNSHAWTMHTFINRKTVRMRKTFSSLSISQSMFSVLIHIEKYHILLKLRYDACDCFTQLLNRFQFQFDVKFKSHSIFLSYQTRPSLSLWFASAWYASGVISFHSF